MSTLNSVPPEPQVKPPGEDNASVIDTSKMNEGQRAALELTEAARDAASEQGSFVGDLFMGRCDLHRVFPFPEQSPTDKDQGDAFLAQLSAVGDIDFSHPGRRLRRHDQGPIPLPFLEHP